MEIENGGEEKKQLDKKEELQKREENLLQRKSANAGRAWYKAIIDFRPKFKIIYQFYKGDEIDVDTVDLYINTFILSNALILTIPFGMFGDWNTSYWDGQRQAMEDGGCGSVKQFGAVYSSWRTNMLVVIYASALVIISAIFYYLLRPSGADKESSQQALMIDQLKDMNEILREIQLQGIQKSDDAKMPRALLHTASEKVDHETREMRVTKEEAEQEFKEWWKRARFVVGMMFILSTASFVSVLLLTSDYFVYQVILSNHICSPDSNRDAIVGGTWFCVCFLITSVFLMAV